MRGAFSIDLLQHVTRALKLPKVVNVYTAEETTKNVEVATPLTSTSLVNSSHSATPPLLPAHGMVKGPPAPAVLGQRASLSASRPNKAEAPVAITAGERKGQRGRRTTIGERERERGRELEKWLDENWRKVVGR